MAKQDFEKDPWTFAADRLKRQIEADHYNHLLLGNAWSRVAHSMVQACRIRQSQRHHLPPASRRPPILAWRQAIQAMIGSLHSRARQQRLRATWLFWAAQRPLPTRRYLRKTWQPARADGCCVQSTSCEA